MACLGPCSRRLELQVVACLALRHKVDRQERVYSAQLLHNHYNRHLDCSDLLPRVPRQTLDCSVAQHLTRRVDCLHNRHNRNKVEGCLVAHSRAQQEVACSEQRLQEEDYLEVRLLTVPPCDVECFFYCTLRIPVIFMQHAISVFQLLQLLHHRHHLEHL